MTLISEFTFTVTLSAKRWGGGEMGGCVGRVHRWQLHRAGDIPHLTDVVFGLSFSFLSSPGTWPFAIR